jgi:uncharacterized membrane protein
MGTNNRLVVLTFPKEEIVAVPNIHGTTTPIGKDVKDTQGWATWKTIQKAAKEADVQLKDAAIVYKTQDGRIQLKQTMDLTTGKGAGRGSFWGFLIGLVLGGPIGGALLGVVAGAIYGGMTDKGIDDKFMRNVGQAMQPQTSAIFLLIKEEDYAQAIPYLKSFDAEIHESEFSDKAEDAVNKALENEDVAKAIDVEVDEA